ncbi:MAG: hypothetical protein D6B25_05965 [Desulfobulbaceae bacterium]|nr:MAG: hypothetical protein D6B25_05965 [Desulfobulbaceae bacterium]
MSDERKSFRFMMLSGGYSTDLRGKQSVRTTFKLSPKCIDAMSLLAGQLGIKQKSLFDHLMDDTQALKAIAEESPEEQTRRSERVAKTYVISRRTLEVLEHFSRKFETPRDILVEFSIERIMPLVEEERKKHEQRKKLLERIDDLHRSSRKLLAEADQTLDSDDPVLERLFHIHRSVDQGCQEIDSIIAKGRKLEEFSG